MKTGFTPLALAALALPLMASGAQADEPARTRDDKVPAATKVGEPVNCIQPSRIRSTDVHSNKVIDFEMDNGDVYRNTLSNACPSLGFEKRFSYSTSINRLCSVDIIYPLQNYGDSLQRGAGCGLGNFQKVEITKSKPKG